MKPSAELTAFSKRLGHNFHKPELLIQAMTHSSLSSATRGDNQRFEFLGDRVLGLSISDALFHKDSDAAEGLLAPRFNALVRKETCAEIAVGIRLGEALKMGRSEMLSGGRRKIAVLGDAMEAVIGAVYLDAGFEIARDVVLRLWENHINNAAHDARDSKTILQENNNNNNNNKYLRELVCICVQNVSKQQHRHRLEQNQKIYHHQKHF